MNKLLGDAAAQPSTYGFAIDRYNGATRYYGELVFVGQY
jgi:hypothetical protein